MNDFENQAENSQNDGESQPRPVPMSTSIDSLTIAYLKGEISFQEYETLIENQHFRNELMLNQSGILDTFNYLPTSSTSEIELNSDIDQYASNSLVPVSSGGQSRKRSSLSQSSSASSNTASNKTKKNTNSNNNQESSQIEDFIEDFDDTSQWNDFDIETLNFDKFLKDHQISLSNNQHNSADQDYLNSGIDPNTNNKKSSNLNQSFGFNKRKKDDNEDPVELRAKRRRNRALPIEIQGLMGEANLAYARGETSRAIDACLEVVKYAPKASEPFQLLALLYSEMGQNDKALRVGLIAAQLNKDSDEWIQLIQQALMEGDVELVLFCYNNAIQCDPKNIQLHIERIRLLEDNKDQRRLILAKLMLLKYADVKTNLDVYEKYFNQVMNELNQESDRNKKIYVLKNDMKKFQEKFLVESKIVCSEIEI